MPGIRGVNKDLKENFAKDSLRMQGLLRKRKETLEEFLIDFFNVHNNKRDTLFVETKEVQTKPGKRRSIGDIYAICKYYYPDCTIREVTNIIYNTLPTEAPRFRSSMCSQIKKRVFYQGTEEQETGMFNTNNPDEFGLTVEEWKNL